jgi:Glyoxalase/Bleomycin resistance protein/Dioxygenase superfamily
MEPFFQTGVFVRNAEAAMEELAAGLGIQFGDLHLRELGDWKLKVAFSLGEAPFIELIQGSPGSPWDAKGTSRLDHIGLWSDGDLESETRRLEELGASIDVDGTKLGGLFRYMRLPETGLRIEIFDPPYRPRFYDLWFPNGSETEGTRESYFQIGMRVRNVESAMRELSAALGIRFGAVVEHGLGNSTIRVAFSEELPHIELLEVSPGSLVVASGEPGLDHLGWWSDDLDADTRRLEDAGISLVVPIGPDDPFRLFYAPVSGLRVELLDKSRQSTYRPDIGLEPVGQN